jgi:ABC-2 type transport system ATP-binding protein
VAELGPDHGKSVILSTHLLADVQSVCERVVILAGGRVRGQGTVGELCSIRQDRFRLRFLGDAVRFREDLENEGVKVLADNGHGEWRVAVPAGWSNLAFFKLADLNDVTIRALLRDDETLEELFLRTVNSEAA